MKTGRNDPCPCGSGKKYKKCCEQRDAELAHSRESSPAITVQSLLQGAVQLHQSGQFDAAENMYKQVLKKDPNQPDALHLLGMIFHQKGDYAEAERQIRRAVSLDPNAAFFHLNLGNALKEQGKTEDAENEYRKAIRLDPNMAEAHYNLANELQLKGFNEEAIDSYLYALRLNPGLAEAYYNLGNALKTVERKDDAIKSFESAIRLKPDYEEAHYGLGVILADGQDTESAEKHYRLALQINPSYVDACIELADLLRKQERAEEAEIYLRRVIEINPRYAEAYNDLGVVLRQQGRIEEAISVYETALEFQPDLAAAYNNLAGVYQEDGQVDRAISCCRKAIKARPYFADAHWNLALALLFSGNFSEGWKEYDWRFLKADPTYRPFPQPTWDGSSLRGKTLLIYSEQGIGDHAMFASMIGEIVERCDKCIIECDFRLVSLFQRSFPRAIVMPIVPNPEEFHSYGTTKIDYKVAMGSLPFYTRMDIADFPDRKKYLVPDSLKSQEWTGRFDALGPGLKVGISWRGGKERSVRTMRSTMLEQWSAILRLQGVHFVNLQYGSSTDELMEVRERYGVTIHHWDDSNPLKDMDGFAAQISALDLVISVDNSTVHMAGALGIPTWTLLPKGCDWRWMDGVDDTPWYESVRLIRQRRHGEWDEVFESIAVMLQRSVEERLVVTPEIEHSYKEMKSVKAQYPIRPIRRSYSGNTYKCAVITPVGPGHKDFYANCLASINGAFATNHGCFSEIVPLMIDDTQAKLGRSRARNIAVKRAADMGLDWLFFIDADDEMSPDAFEAVSPYLDGYDAIWGSIWSIEKDEREARERQGQLPFLLSIRDVLSCDPFVTLQMGHFVRTSVAATVEFDESLDAGEDFDYYLRVWEKHGCIKIPVPFFYNRRGHHSIGEKSATGIDWRQQVERIMSEYRRTH